MTSTPSPTVASKSTEDTAAADPADGTHGAAHAATMVQAFELTSAALADRVAIRTKGDEQTLTWAQWRRRTRDLAGGLQRLGPGPGGTAALLGGERPEVHVGDDA